MAHQAWIERFQSRACGFVYVGVDMQQGDFELRMRPNVFDTGLYNIAGHQIYILMALFFEHASHFVYRNTSITCFLNEALTPFLVWRKIGLGERTETIKANDLAREGVLQKIS